MALSNYINLILEQRKNYPRYSKHYYTNPLSPFVNLTAQEVAADLLTYNAAEFTNTIEVTRPLYSDVDDLVYYEFVNSTFIPNGTLSDWRYFYIPVSFRDPSFLIEGQPFIDQVPLPYFNRYNAYEQEVERVYPHKPFMHRIINRPSVYSFGEPLQSQRHPFGNHFLFTGNFYLKPNINKYVYEYIDYQQVAHYATTILHSDIPPIGFYPLSNRVVDNSWSDALNTGIGLPPVTLDWTGDVLPDLRSSGRLTNQYFAGKHLWHEYVLYIDDQPTDRYLLPDPPTSLDLNYVKVFLGGDMGINLPIQFNTQTIKYKQISNNNYLSLYP